MPASGPSPQPPTLPAELASLNTWGLRLALAARGWISDTRMMTGRPDEDLVFQVWVSRWDWHGRNCDRVTFHSAATVRPSDPALSVPRMARAVRTAAARALAAWERFPDRIPQQSGDGDLVENTIATDIIFRRNGWKTPEAFPTEAMPADPRPYCDAGDGDPTLERALGFVAQGWGYEDGLTHMHRNAHDLRDRRWGFDHEISTGRWHGEPVRLHRWAFAVEHPLETVVVSSLDGTRLTMERLLDAYRPGGPRGERPPGMLTRVAAAVADERKRRDADIAGLGTPLTAASGWDADDIRDELEHVVHEWTRRWTENPRLQAHLPSPTHAEVLALAADRYGVDVARFAAPDEADPAGDGDAARNTPPPGPR